MGSDSDDDWESSEEDTNQVKIEALVTKEAMMDSEVSLKPTSTPVQIKSKEKLLGIPKKASVPAALGSTHKKHALREFTIKTMPDMEALVNTLVRSKLFPSSNDHKNMVQTKSAAWKFTKAAMEQKMGTLEPKELDKLERELLKQIELKKTMEAAAELDAKKEELKKEAAEKARRDEELRLEAEAKGEQYVNDEDYFAGLE